MRLPRRARVAAAGLVAAAALGIWLVAESTDSRLDYQPFYEAMAETELFVESPLGAQVVDGDAVFGVCESVPSPSFYRIWQFDADVSEDAVVRSFVERGAREGWTLAGNVWPGLAEPALGDEEGETILALGWENGSKDVESVFWLRTMPRGDQYEGRLHVIDSEGRLCA